MCLASVPEAGDSIGASAWRSQMLASSAALNTKHTQSKSWLRKWKTATWMTRLFGRICDPSTASRGVESWILSLAATRANRSQSPASVLEQTILATYGRTSLESLAKLNPASCFAKMSQDTLFSDLRPLETNFKDWVTALQQDSLARRKLARHTDANGFLSWHVETNPTWGTPAPFDAADIIRTEDEKAEVLKIGGCKNLREDAVNWVSPTAIGRGKGEEVASLKRSERTGGVYLEDQVQMWRTPAGSDGEGGIMDLALAEREGYDVKVKLRDQSVHWPTPSASSEQRDRQSDEALAKVGARAIEGSNLANTARFHLHQTTAKAGCGCSKPTRRLNPRFVSALMGWPIGLTSFEFSETALSRYVQLMRSCLFTLVCGRA